MLSPPDLVYVKARQQLIQPCRCESQFRRRGITAASPSTIRNAASHVPRTDTDWPSPARCEPRVQTDRAHGSMFEIRGGQAVARQDRPRS